NNTSVSYVQLLRIIAEELTTLPPKYHQLLTFIAARTVRFNKSVERIPLDHFIKGIRSDSKWIQRPVGMARNAVSRGLQELEDAGLIHVERGTNNVKLIGLAADLISEGVEEMNSRLRIGKPKKQKVTAPNRQQLQDEVDANTTQQVENEDELHQESVESYPPVSPKWGNRYHQNGETGITKMGKPNIRSRNKHIESNSGSAAESVSNFIDMVKSASKAAQDQWALKLLPHKMGMKTFSSYVKENYPTVRATAPSAPAARNFRLAVEGLCREEITDFVTTVVENWETILRGTFGYLLKSDPNLAAAPCATVFGLNAAKFLDAYQRRELIKLKERIIPQRQRREVPPTDEPQAEPSRTRAPRRRVATKAERLQELGVTPTHSAPVISEEEKQQRLADVERRIRERMEATGESYDEADWNVSMEILNG
ncbi:MAG: hypothetical protein LPH21_17625, partial [Shewanella sp.]|nr:hypothetical protein [Shewanella sp.]